MYPNKFLIILSIFLVTIGAVIDMATHRLPNKLTVSTALAGFLAQGYVNGITGVLDGLAGFMVSTILFFPFFLVRWMGAGDVKMLMAIGVCLGWSLTWLASMATLAIGAVFGVTILVVKGGLWAYLERYGLMLKTLLLTGNAAYIPPAPDETAAERFPYAMAIALGTLIALFGPIRFPWLRQFVLPHLLGG